MIILLIICLLVVGYQAMNFHNSHAVINNITKIENENKEIRSDFKIPQLKKLKFWLKFDYILSAILIACYPLIAWFIGPGESGMGQATIDYISGNAYYWGIQMNIKQFEILLMSMMLIGPILGRLLMLADMKIKQNKQFLIDAYLPAAELIHEQ